MKHPNQPCAPYKPNYCEPYKQPNDTLRYFYWSRGKWTKSLDTYESTGTTLPISRLSTLLNKEKKTGDTAVIGACNGYYSGIPFVKITTPYDKKASDALHAKAVAKYKAAYEKQLGIYEARQAEYKKSLVKYKDDLRKYNLWCAQGQLIEAKKKLQKFSK